MQLHSAECIYSKTGHHYEVKVHTGVWRNSGTTAHVRIVLYGSEENSQLIVLNPDQQEDTFTRAGTDTFIVCVENPLGHIHSLHVGHDNTGENSSWFLDDIVVTDIQNGECMIFECRRWLATEKEDGITERVLRMRDPAIRQSFLTNFHSRAVKSIAEEHVWLSVLTKHPRESFTRAQRVSCCLSFLYMSMLANAMYYREGGVSNITVTIGPIKFTTQDIFISLASTFLVAPVNMLIAFLFRKAKANSVSATSQSNLLYSRRKTNTLTTFTLPHFCVSIAWTLSIVTSLTSAMFIIFYSLQFGTDKANRWILAVFLSCLEDAFLFQPAWIFFQNIMCSLIRARLSCFKDDDSQDITVATPGTGDTGIPPMSLGSGGAMQRKRKFKRLEKQMYSYLGDVVLYLLFVATIMIYCYGQRDGASAYYNVKEMKDTLAMTEKVHVQFN